MLLEPDQLVMKMLLEDASGSTTPDWFKGTNHWIRVNDVIFMGLLICFIWDFQQRFVAYMLKYYWSPPVLRKNNNYCSWKKELQIWETIISLAPGKRTPTVFLTLTGETKEPILNLEMENTIDDNASQNFIKIVG